MKHFSNHYIILNTGKQFPVSQQMLIDIKPLPQELPKYDTHENIQPLQTQARSLSSYSMTMPMISDSRAQCHLAVIMRTPLAMHYGMPRSPAVMSSTRMAHEALLSNYIYAHYKHLYVK